MKIKNILTACLVCCGFAAALTSCSSDDDPFFTAGEDDAPRILNTDIPEGTGGVPGVLNTIERTTNFTFEVIVTPVDNTTVKWYIDDELVAEGLKIDIPLLAGTHTLKIVATTTNGKETSRTCYVKVNPAASDPVPGSDIKERLVKQGSKATLTGANMDKVVKVIIGKTEVAATYDAAAKCVSYTVPDLPDGTYRLKVADAEGTIYGAGEIELNTNPQYPGVKETVLWEGATDINWGESNILISPDVMAKAPVGAKIQVHYELVDMPENYHCMRITTNKWGDNPEDQVVAQFDLNGETPNPYEFTYTAANKEIVDSREGMLIVGYGYKVTKVVVVEGEASAETTLWEGATDINWGESNVLISPDDMAAVAVGSTVCVYYEMVDMPENYHCMRITTNKWGDNPEDQVVAQFDLNGETANPYEFTYTAANKEIVDSREGMLIVGYGYKVTKVTFKK